MASSQNCGLHVIHAFWENWPAMNTNHVINTRVGRLNGERENHWLTFNGNLSYLTLKVLCVAQCETFFRKFHIRLLFSLHSIRLCCDTYNVITEGIHVGWQAYETMSLWFIRHFQLATHAGRGFQYTWCKTTNTTLCGEPLTKSVATALKHG